MMKDKQTNTYKDMIEAENIKIFDLALSESEAAKKKLENLAQESADLNSVQNNVGDDAGLSDKMQELKDNMGQYLDSLMAGAVNSEVLDILTIY